MTTTEPSTALDETPSTPAPTRLRGVFPVRKLSDEQEREVTRLYAETATPLGEIGQRFGIGHTSVARIAQRRGAPLRTPSISPAMASGRQGSAASADAGRAIESETKPTQPEPAAQATVGPSARGPQSASGRRTRPWSTERELRHRSRTLLRLPPRRGGHGRLVWPAVASFAVSWSPSQPSRCSKRSRRSTRCSRPRRVGRLRSFRSYAWRE